MVVLPAGGYAERRQARDVPVAEPAASHIVDKANNGNYAMAKLRAVRFWGFAPPDAPHGDALTDETRELATQLCQWQMTAPYSIAG